MTAGFSEEGLNELPRTVELEDSSAEPAVRASAYQAVSLSVSFVDRSLSVDKQLSVFAAFACLNFDGELHDAYLPMNSPAIKTMIAAIEPMKNPRIALPSTMYQASVFPTKHPKARAV